MPGGHQPNISRATGHNQATGNPTSRTSAERPQGNRLYRTDACGIWQGR
jgi:hypothetical protein